MQGNSLELKQFGYWEGVHDCLEREDVIPMTLPTQGSARSRKLLPWFLLVPATPGNSASLKQLSTDLAYREFGSLMS